MTEPVVHRPTLLPLPDPRQYSDVKQWAQVLTAWLAQIIPLLATSAEVEQVRKELNE